MGSGQTKFREEVGCHEIQFFLEKFLQELSTIKPIFLAGKMDRFVRNFHLWGLEPAPYHFHPKRLIPLVKLLFRFRCDFERGCHQAKVLLHIRATFLRDVHRLSTYLKVLLLFE